MAIFKILKGPSSRIGMDITPFHEGYAYFAPDNNGLYIDAVTDDNQNVRFHINATNVQAISATLAANAWSSHAQTLSITGVTADSDGVIGLAENATAAQFSAAEAAGLHLSAQASGTITIKAMYESDPTVDIPILLLLFN